MHNTQRGQSTHQQNTYTMPIAIKLNDATADGLIDAFAVHDIFLRHMAYKNDDDGTLTALDPGDDDYTGPYALVRKPSTQKRKIGQDLPHPPTYWLVFTAYKIGDVHAKAHMDATITMFRSIGPQKKDRFRMFACVEELFGGKIAKKNVIAFSRFVNSSPSLELEDYAFERSCEAMGVEVPVDWRALRVARRTQLGFDAKEKPPLSPIPELSAEPFKPLTKEEAEERANARIAQAIIDKEAARLQAIANKKEFDQIRLNRYMHTIAESKDAAEPDGDLCVYIFSTDHEGIQASWCCGHVFGCQRPFGEPAASKVGCFGRWVGRWP